MTFMKGATAIALLSLTGVAACDEAMMGTRPMSEPQVGLAAADALDLASAQRLYPNMTAVEFAELDDDGNGILDAQEQRDIEDFDIDDRIEG
ncbi:mannonate dehydratase [Oceanicola granulosus HTCC2516]|uniref:Mannonate dehydratase n=1 Tax=Oceanicola granulosus (strain ATCC BAA-861 / DSM 15982 / KCTC 12143 / HTCC2516) TaxID=314256 RepID=Q2CIL7_OCEGH|nr:hypothetical protein [Oceanicola granulosus]EAR52572.1 mannonate dehydratase [Oceanicola granulosus HTCC2516]